MWNINVPNLVRYTEEAVESDKLLSAHVKVQDLVEERRDATTNYCLACDYSSPDRDHLEEHHSHVHGLSYSCKLCGKTFRLRKPPF